MVLQVTANGHTIIFDDVNRTLFNTVNRRSSKKEHRWPALLEFAFHLEIVVAQKNCWRQTPPVNHDCWRMTPTIPTKRSLLTFWKPDKFLLRKSHELFENKTQSLLREFQSLYSPLFQNKFIKDISYIKNPSLNQ